MRLVAANLLTTGGSAESLDTTEGTIRFRGGRKFENLKNTASDYSGFRLFKLYRCHDDEE